MATGNEYRKVRALLAKTVAAGCTEGEAISSLETALKLIDQYGLDRAKLEITVPEGYTITDGKVVPASKAPRPKKAKAKDGAASKAPRVTRTARLIEMLKAGTTIDAITTEMGILPHTARAMISTANRKVLDNKVQYDRATKTYKLG